MKAISPLIAAVLLIAITLTLAGMIAFWAAAFVRQRVEVLENRTLQECLDADFSIYSCRYDNATQELIIILNNLRGVDLHDITFWIFYPDRIELRPTNQTLPGLQYKSFGLANVSGGFDVIAVRSHCPELEERTTC